MVTEHTGCCVFVPRRLSVSRPGYRPLTQHDLSPHSTDPPGAVTVVVGKERREFVVDPFVLEEEPFRALMRMAGAGDCCGKRRRCGKADEIVFVHVDSILFEHLLWLVGRQDDSCHSVLPLHLKDIIDFYAQDY